MATLSVPPPELGTSSSLSSRGVPHRPLSTHGMPKPPRAVSPNRPHRFSALSFPSPKFPGSPRSPGPMSPPMSAKSFGTFIDSEPSTPAYSPRMDHDWDKSTLILMRPMSSSSEPSTPREPAWDMINIPARDQPTSANSKAPTVTSLKVSKASPPLPQSTKAFKPAKRPRDIHIVNLSQQDDLPTMTADVEVGEQVKEKERGILSPGFPPLGKFASKMKLMLRRKNTSEKKKEKKQRHREEVDRLEDVHWTEM